MCVEICLLPLPPCIFKVQCLIKHSDSCTAFIYTHVHVWEPWYLSQYSDHAVGWTIGVLGFNFWQGLRIFFFTTVSRLPLGPTQTPVWWVLGAFSLGVKSLGYEADCSLPSSTEVKNVCSVPPLLQYIFLAWWFVKQTFQTSSLKYNKNWWNLLL
jgi:hypothetical protein